MGHSKTASNEIIKTFSFKVQKFNKHSKSVFIDAIREQQDYYNKCSDWFKDNLTMKIGDLYDSVPEASKREKYAQNLLSDEWKDKPLYKMLLKGYNNNNANNALFCVISGKDIDEYKDNILNIRPTYFRRQGYFSNVVANYRTSLSTLKSGVKRKRLSITPTDEEIVEQIAYEIEAHNLSNKKEWENYINYIESLKDNNIEYIDRIKFLYSYYVSHQETIDDKIYNMMINRFIKFNGCHKNYDKLSMYVMGEKETLKIQQIGNNSFNIKFGKSIDIDVYGRRDVIINDEMIVDIIEKHGQSFVLKVINNEMYIDINVKVPYSKNITEGKKVLGVDINTKHASMVTNVEDDGNLKGYVNIYKEALNDENFKKCCSESILKNFKDLSKYVTFGPIETDLLFSRVSKQMGVYDSLCDIEESFSDVLNKLTKRFIETGDNKSRIYIQNVCKLRSQIKAYFVLKTVYSREHSFYDEGKDMDFIEKNPFSSTVKGKEILKKMDSIEQQIIGCRNNIIQYTYDFANNNGFDTIALEKLTSSQFEKIKSLPSVKSLLKYHKIEGNTTDEIKTKGVFQFIEDGYYNLIFENDKVVDAELSEKGKIKQLKTNFNNLLIKSIHFADFKGYFITLSNNGEVNVSLVPPYFTSQMNSLNHTIYCKKNMNKIVLLPKQDVRKKQEEHINGLNADYNAACNIAYIVSDEEWKKTFLSPTKIDKPLYNKPTYDTNIKSQTSIIDRIKKINAITILP